MKKLVCFVLTGLLLQDTFNGGCVSLYAKGRQREYGHPLFL